MKQTKVPKCACPTCDTKLDGAASMDGDYTPQADDFTICIECGSILRFNDDLTLRQVTPLEFDDLPEEVVEYLFEAQQAITNTKNNLLH